MIESEKKSAEKAEKCLNYESQNDRKKERYTERERERERQREMRDREKHDRD